MLVGQTVAIPLDGNEQEPDGFWTLESIINFNDEDLFNTDGLRTVFVTAEDVAGNVSTVNAASTFQFFLDTQGPQVNGVFITDADLVGLDFMANAGFDPRAAVYLWKNMAAEKTQSGREAPPEFLSTHPSDSTRIDQMIRSLTPALVKYNAAREAGNRPACTMASR